MGTGYSVTLLLRVDLGVIWAGKLGHLEFRSRGRWGKNQEDEHTFISHTKERSRKKPGFGHSRLARRPAAGLMKHLQCGTCASATKMCWGSADVPGPPEQNNDIITNSVTDQTVHKVTGEGGLEYTHTQRTFHGCSGCGPEGWAGACPVSSSQVELVSLSAWVLTQFQRVPVRQGKSEPLWGDSE